MSEPWDVPESEQGREQLKMLIHKYESAGQNPELARCLTRMAFLVKQIGDGENTNAFKMSWHYGKRAVRIARQTHDKKALCDALRAAANPIYAKDREILLREALQIARDIGDAKREGWAIYALAMMWPNQDSPRAGLTLRDAIACFERADCPRGKAIALQSLGTHREPGSWRNCVTAAKLFEQDGDFKSAARAYVFAETFGHREHTPEQLRSLLLEGVRLAKQANELLMLAGFYVSLAKSYEEVGDEITAPKFRDLEDDLDVPLFGSRANRLRKDVEVLEELKGFSNSEERAAIRAKINRIKLELDSVRELNQ